MSESLIDFHFKIEICDVPSIVQSTRIGLYLFLLVNILLKKEMKAKEYYAMPSREENQHADCSRLKK
jgi:hypothetical protein